MLAAIMRPGGCSSQATAAAETETESVWRGEDPQETALHWSVVGSNKEKRMMMESLCVPPLVLREPTPNPPPQTPTPHFERWRRWRQTGE